MFYYTEQNIVTFEFNKNVSRVCSEPFWANVSLLDNIWRNTCCLFPEVAIIWLKSSTQYRLEQYWQDCSASSPRIEIFTVVWSEGSELLPSGATCVKIGTTSFRPERERAPLILGWDQEFLSRLLNVSNIVQFYWLVTEDFHCTRL